MAEALVTIEVRTMCRYSRGRSGNSERKKVFLQTTVSVYSLDPSMMLCARFGNESLERCSGPVTQSQPKRPCDDASNTSPIPRGWTLQVCRRYETGNFSLCF